MLLYYKYRTDYGNTIIDSSPTSFALGANEAEIQLDFTIPSTQPYYYWRELASAIVPNTDENIENWENNTIPTSPDDSVPYSVFTGYTATTTVSAGVTVNFPYKYSDNTSAPPPSKFFELNNSNAAFATEMYLHYVNNNQVDVSNILLSVNKGAKIYLQNLSDSNQAALYTITGDSIDNGNYVTFPISLLSGGVDLTFTNNKEFGFLLNESSGIFVSLDHFNSYTGVTETRLDDIEADVIYVSGQTTIKVSTSKFNTYTGTTAPATYQTKSSINIYTGTTAPNQFASKSIFNSYTGTTNSAINSRLLISTFNTFTGTTAPATYLTKTAFNTYTGTSAGISSANNGLTKNGTNVRLGGSLTGSTIITSPATGSRLSFAGFPVQYSTDLSGNFNPRSLVDKAYVTGITSTLATQAKVNTYTGTTAPATYVAKSVFSTFTGTTALQSSNNGLTKNGTNVRLGGSLTGETTITSPATGSRLSFAGFPIQYSTDVSSNFNPRSLVDKAYVTGLTSSNVYGTQYQLRLSGASTSTTSTTPIAKVTMVTPSLPSGTYKITVSWVWSINSTANSARFNLTIGGVAQGTRTTMELEAGDVTDVRPESRSYYVALSGVNTIVFNHWAEVNTNTTTTSDASIELIRVA